MPVSGREFLESRGLADLSLHWPSSKPVPQVHYDSERPQPTLAELLDLFAEANSKADSLATESKAGQEPMSKIDTSKLSDKQCREILAAMQLSRELGYRDGYLASSGLNRLASTPAQAQKRELRVVCAMCEQDITLGKSSEHKCPVVFTEEEMRVHIALTSADFCDHYCCGMKTPECRVKAFIEAYNDYEAPAALTQPQAVATRKCTCPEKLHDFGSSEMNDSTCELSEEEHAAQAVAPEPPQKKRMMSGPLAETPHEWCPECVGLCDEVTTPAAVAPPEGREQADEEALDQYALGISDVIYHSPFLVNTEEKLHRFLKERLLTFGKAYALAAHNGDAK